MKRVAERRRSLDGQCSRASRAHRCAEAEGGAGGESERRVDRARRNLRDRRGAFACKISEGWARGGRGADG